MVLIYALLCLENGNAYIGCTGAKLSKRLREHRCLLRAGKHSEKRLQADWTRFGESSFQMIPLRALLTESVDAKREAELLMMSEFRQRGLLYNTNWTSFSPTKEAIEKGIAAATEANRVRVHSEESRIKRRLAQLGKPKGHGAKISATKQARKAMR